MTRTSFSPVYVLIMAWSWWAKFAYVICRNMHIALDWHCRTASVAVLREWLASYLALYFVYFISRYLLNLNGIPIATIHHFWLPSSRQSSLKFNDFKFCKLRVTTNPTLIFLYSLHHMWSTRYQPHSSFHRVSNMGVTWMCLQLDSGNDTSAVLSVLSRHTPQLHCTYLCFPFHRRPSQKNNEVRLE